MSSEEIRGWLQFCVLLVGGTVGLLAFLQNNRQRKIENAFKLIAWVKENWSDDEIGSWKNLVRATYEGTGAIPGQYVSEDGGLRCLGDYFSEGAPDSGAFSRTVELLEVACYEMLKGTVEERLVWFEFGQVLRTIEMWLGAVSSGPIGGEGSSLLDRAYPNISSYFKKRKPAERMWPSRILIYSE